MKMKVGTGLGDAALQAGQAIVGGWLGGIADSVRGAETGGYDFVTTGEQNHDPFLRIAIAAEHSERIELQTSVAISFPRSPFVTAMMSWDLQQFSSGRFVLGIGSQVKAHNERRFSTPWSGPAATRMREYVRCLHAIWDSWETGTPPNFEGQYFKFNLLTPHFNPGPLDTRRPRVAMSVVGEAMARAAGDVADGVLPHGFTTEKYLREVTLPNVKVGLDRSRRSWEDVDISTGGFSVFGEDQVELEQGVERLRQTVAYYGSTPAYQGVWRIHGWDDLGQQLHLLSREQKWEEMTRLITDDVMDVFVLRSTYEDLPAFLREHKRYASRVNVSLPLETPEQRERATELIGEINEIEVDRSDISSDPVRI